MLKSAFARSPFDSESLARVARRTDGDRRSTAELVPWLFRFSDALVVNKDSALMATYAFSGPDADALSTGHILELMDNLVTSLRDTARRPVTMWWTVHRRRSAQYLSAPMPDPVSQQVDDARRATFEQAANYTNRHYVTFTLAPEVGIDRFAGKVSHGMTRDGLPVARSLMQAVRGTFSDQYLFAYTASELATVVETFEHILFGFVAGNPRLACRRLSGDRLGASCTPAARPPAIICRPCRSPTFLRSTSPCAIPKCGPATTTSISTLAVASASGSQQAFQAAVTSGRTAFCRPVSTACSRYRAR